MMRVYLNYPNAEIILHTNAVCTEGSAAASSRTRQVDISPTNLSQELQRFINGQVIFSDLTYGREAQQRDLWLNLQFNDPQFELALLGYIRRLLGQRYDRFLSCKVTIHCWPSSAGFSLIHF